MRLSEEDRTKFCDNGYLYLPNAFSSTTATECRQMLWESLENDQGILKADPLTWKKKTSLPKIFTKEDGKPWNEVYGSGISDVLDEICGKETYIPNTNCGWWMITFPGFSEQPWGSDGRWHVDGHWYRHYPFSSEIGAILVMFFSDVLPEMGGTAVAVGSHKCITRALVHAGIRGLSHSELSFVISSCMDQTSYPMEELTGRAGDVVIMHPFLIHARSKNLGSQDPSAVRFMCHPNVSLKQPMRFSENASSSLLHRSIYEACGGDHPHSSTDLTHFCTCEYHSPFPSSTAPSEHPISETYAARDGVSYPSLLGILRGITPEACEALQMRKRAREEEEKEQDDSSRFLGQTDEIAAVMGFGTFSSSKKFQPESSH